MHWLWQVYWMYGRALDKNGRGCTDWNEEKLMFDLLGEKEFRHRKIKLDIESGEGAFCL